MVGSMQEHRPLFDLYEESFEVEDDAAADVNRCP